MTEHSLVGTLFAGRYRIESLLGSGGVGEVYLGWHEVLQRRIALKLIHASLQVDPKVLARFRREARAASTISHPGIPHIHDFGHAEDGRPYLVMDHVEGETLARVLRRLGALPVPRAVDLLVQITSALAAAHGAKVVHRDLKPDNVMLSPTEGGQDQIKILDFGLAKVLSSDTAELTTEGSFHGTPEYLPPELIDGREVDHRADIYSLGVLAYELLTGEVPFPGTLFQVLNAHLKKEPLAPSTRARRDDIPEALDRLVLRCLVKDPRQRFQSAEEVLEGLGQITPTI